MRTRVLRNRPAAIRRQNLQASIGFGDPRRDIRLGPARRTPPRLSRLLQSGD